MRCKKCGEENAEMKRCCSSCGAFLEGYTFNNVTAEFGYRGGDGGWYKNKAEYMKTRKNMKVYISGKIGEEVISDATRQKFARAEEMLKAKGYTVFNPTSKSWQKYLSIILSVGLPIKSMDKYSFILLEDLQELAKYDAIYFLEDWNMSPCAGTEHSFAMATGKKILFASREQAVHHLEEEWRKANKAMNMRTPRYKYVDLHLHELWMPIEQK